jgi:cation:H+ antiporter
MFLAITLLIIGLALLVYGGDRLVYSASILSRFLGVPPVIIGMVVVGTGTSLPELVISVTTTLTGQVDMTVGNVLGANIMNILLITSSAALIHPLTVCSNILRRELPFMLFITVLCGFLLADSYLSYIDGIILLMAAGIFIAFILHNTRLANFESNDTLAIEQLSELPQNSNNTVAILWLVLAFVVLPLSAKMVIDNATVIAHALGLSDLVVGLIIISAGTSLPELATSVAGILKGENDIVLGNVIGANIFNIAIVLCVPALFSHGEIDPQAFARDYWVMLAASIVLTVLCLRRKYRIGRMAGSVLLGGFIAYLMLVIFSSIERWPV